MTDKVKVGLTIEEFMRLNDDGWLEVVKGEPVKKDMSAAGFLHAIVIENLREILKPFVKARDLGYVFGDGLSYVLAAKAKTIANSRLPDVSFIRKENFKRDFDWEQPYPGAPDLAVEVVSPNKKPEETEAKIKDYRAAGTEQIWVIYASSKEVHVHLRDATAPVRVYGAEDVLEAETLFPGLKIKVADLFRIGEEENSFMPTLEALWQALDEVKDPEIPVVSLVEMGIVREVQLDGERAVVTITPTFSGCPALHAMKEAIAERLHALGIAEVQVETTLTPPWSSDWITEAARAKLKSFGLAPPPVHGGNVEITLLEEVACPYCGSTDTSLRNSFGSTLCRMIFYCNHCQQPFEQFKPL